MWAQSGHLFIITRHPYPFSTAAIPGAAVVTVVATSVVVVIVSGATAPPKLPTEATVPRAVPVFAITFATSTMPVSAFAGAMVLFSLYRVDGVRAV